VEGRRPRDAERVFGTGVPAAAASRDRPGQRRRRGGALHEAAPSSSSPTSTSPSASWRSGSARPGPTRCRRSPRTST
jgi:hypothetical protein